MGARKKQRNSQPVLIRWLDIMSWPGWNDELLENGEDEPGEFLTLGYIINETKDKITISDTENEIGNVTTFPRGCVLEVIPLVRKPLGEKNDTKAGKSSARPSADNE